MKNNFLKTVGMCPPCCGEGGLNNLIRGLVEFVHILRRLGIKASVAETKDAVDALSWVDIMDREEVKAALRAVLAKSRYDRKVFNLAFDAYFVPPEIRRQRLELRRKRLAAKGSALQECEDQLVRAIKEDDRDWGKEILNLLYLTVEENEKMSIRPGPAKKQFFETIDRMRENSSNDPLPQAAGNAESPLTRWRRQMLKQAVKIGAVPPVKTISTGVEEQDEVIETVTSSLGVDCDSDSILHKNMKKIVDSDLPRATLLIKKLSRRLATRISRRYSRKNKRGRLDIRRTIRRNTSYGGALIDLKFQSRRKQKPRLVLICDVSGSMARYAVFVMQFIYGLSRVVKGIESFVFSEELERVTPYFKKVESFARTMSSLMEKSDQWGMGTNLHASLVAFLEKHRRLLSPAVFVIIVSDAQTIQAYQAAGDLHEIRSRVRDIIWLNTLPREAWKHSPEIIEFQKYCRMFECSTLDQLNKVLSNQMLNV